jgi:hypothetical protein
MQSSPEQTAANLEPTGRRPHVHANFPQGLSIAKFSDFKALQLPPQLLDGFGRQAPREPC